MTAEQYKPIYHWFSDHPAVKRLVVFLDRWLPLVPFVCYPVLLCLLNEFRENNETVMYAPAEGFYATPGLGRDELRIAYILKAEDMARGIELLGKGIEAYKAKGGK